MTHGKLTREEAVFQAGEDAVNKIESMNCDFTNRVQTDGDSRVEFAAATSFIDREGFARIITVYYYQEQDDLDAVEDLGQLNWVSEGYEVD